jgi:hypothetical protein
VKYNRWGRIEMVVFQDCKLDVLLYYFQDWEYLDQGFVWGVVDLKDWVIGFDVVDLSIVGEAMEEMREMFSL